MKTVLSVLALMTALAPTFALAEGGCHHDNKVKMSCAEGQAWDDAAKRCAPVVG